MEVNNLIFNKPNFELISSNALRVNPSLKSKSSWDPFEHHVYSFSQKRKLNRDNLLVAMGIAYSWMPTMLDIYIDDYNSLDIIVTNIKELRKIRSYDQLSNSEASVTKKIESIASVINNSVVGASKVLHLFSPENIPIVDSRVVRAWNEFFREIPEVHLKGCQTTISPKKYIYYWKALLFWKKEAKLQSVRPLEKAFFDYGGTISKNKKLNARH